MVGDAVRSVWWASQGVLGEYEVSADMVQLLPAASVVKLVATMIDALSADALGVSHISRIKKEGKSIASGVTSRHLAGAISSRRAFLQWETLVCRRRHEVRFRA